MGDIDGPIVAERVYEELFKEDSELLDPDCVPYALNAALQELRSRKIHPPDGLRMFTLVFERHITRSNVTYVERREGCYSHHVLLHSI